MPVYVDDMQAKSPKLTGRRGRYIFSHMVADTLEELHAMAEKLGVRKWFQGDASFPHYDITQSKRAQAISLGAKEINQRELAIFMRNYRAKEGEIEPRVTRLLREEDEPVRRTGQIGGKRPTSR